MKTVRLVVLWFLIAHVIGVAGQAQDILGGASVIFGPPRTSKSVVDLVAAMRQFYDEKWYKNTTFTQIQTEFGKDGSRKARIQYLAMSAPGNLRVDFDPLAKHDGIVFMKDRMYRFQDGRINDQAPYIHPLLLLQFDVYFLPVEQSVEKLRSLQFNLSLLREDKWQGKTVYVVGAESASDTRSPQFWIDKNRLYLVRMFLPTGKGSREVQLDQHQRLAGGWIASQVIFKVDGQTTATQSNSNIRANVSLSDDLFDPEKWATAKHWKE